MSLKFNPRWDLLENVTVIGERLAVRLALPDIRKDIFIAVDVSRRRHVLVTIPYGEPCELDERVSVGIAVRTVEMKTSDGQLCSFIEIACLDPQGYPALDVVINEIAEALQSGASIGCVRVVQNVLAKWRRFWSGVKTDVLSREQQIGLFGELWFLQYWLVPSVGLSRSIDMWRGPLGARNDFESQGVGIEIKTSSKVNGVHIINGVEQLLEPIDGVLFLFSLIVREEASSKVSLPNLIEFIRMNLKEDLS
ncbi:PD-(D/E)XK motif protein, partial [Pseudomonas sp. REP124]|uniref:PD-(D/E)XK motif protein n=1 Tax=Pseudomonas sp. REP124 TaxID=2875731 RepID=UPI001CCF8267